MLYVVLLILAAAGWYLFQNQRARRLRDAESADLALAQARRHGELQADEAALLRGRIADLESRAKEETRNAATGDVDVNVGILLPEVLQKLSRGDARMRTRALAEGLREVLACESAEVLLEREGTWVPVVAIPDAPPRGFGAHAVPGPLRELTGAGFWEEVVARQPEPLRDALAKAAPGLAPEDLVLPIDGSVRRLGFLVARGARSSPVSPAVLKSLGTVIAAAGALALEQWEATERLRATNASLNRQAADAAWAARRAEDRLVRTGQLARFGEFAASVAHNLKTPLTFLRGELELLEEKRRAGTLPPAELESAIAKLLDHCKRMRAEIEQAMTFVRPGASPMVELDAASVLQEVARLLSARASECGVAISVETRGDGRMRGNLDNLRHAIANLAGNAIDAMTGSGGGEVLLSMEQRDGVVAIRVRDTGPGLPPSVRARLFQPFVSTKGEAGTGLGLASCRRIIEEEHGGRIALEGSAPTGTTFRIELPR